jgi:hypothetical protein
MKQIALISVVGLAFVASACSSQWVRVNNDIYNRNPGNVGIGTENPQSKLTVVSTDTVPTRNLSGFSVAISSPMLSRAVYGAALNEKSTDNYGGYFTSAGSSSGVFGEASDKENGQAGGVFHCLGKYGAGVIGLALNDGPGVSNFGGSFDARGENGIGIKAKGGPKGYAARFTGNVQIIGRDSGNLIMELGEGLDIAEGFRIAAPKKYEIVPGSVVIIDSENPGMIKSSEKAYDTRVAGIVSGANGLGSAVKLAGAGFDVYVALSGRVFCNVDATFDAVEPGDLLTSSDTPGYAMKARDPERTRGAVIGKAMESVERGQKRMILVLVTLQ